MRLWRRVSLRQQMAWGFALPVLIVLMASMYVANALDATRDAARAAVESTGAIGLRYALLTWVIDSETGLRGYLLSGDPEFLQPYVAAPAQLQRVGRQLESTEESEPQHLRKLRAVQALYQRWRSGFAQPLIALRQSTPVGMAERAERVADLGAVTRTPAQEQALREARDWIHTSLADAHRTPRDDALLSLLERTQTDGAASPGEWKSLKSIADGYRSDEDRITAIIQSRGGKRDIDQIRALMDLSFQDELQEQRRALDTATAIAERARWIARLAPVGALIIGLSLVLLLLLDAIHAIAATIRAAEIVAEGNLDKRIRVMRHDELGQLGLAFNQMASELADRSRRAAVLDRFQSALTSSDSMEELYGAAAGVCGELFPGASGAIYWIAASRNLAEHVASWNWPAAATNRMLDPNDCRALRTGQPYFISTASLEMPCRHTVALGVPVTRSACLPLAAHGEIFGILQLCRFHEELGEIPQAMRSEDVLVANQLAMAMANLKLREQLRQRSIRDPLTGLFNRRYLEETMERELARSARNRQPLAVVVIDVDHFKRFNDTYGHEAGDLVLVELGRLLQASVRDTDIACRYGGEEFVLLMPDSPVSIAMERAEALRLQVAALRLHFGGGVHEPVTISAGVAAAPKDGDRADVLIRNGDSALYAAKSAGRNRVVSYKAA